jgi:hypothetical protein
VLAAPAEIQPVLAQQVRREILALVAPVVLAAPARQMPVGLVASLLSRPQMLVVVKYSVIL